MPDIFPIGYYAMIGLTIRPIRPVPSNPPARLNMAVDVRGTQTLLALDAMGRHYATGHAFQSSQETYTYTYLDKAGKVWGTIQNWDAPRPVRLRERPIQSSLNLSTITYYDRAERPTRVTHPGSEEDFIQYTTDTVTQRKSTPGVSFPKGTWTDTGDFKQTAKWGSVMEIAYTGERGWLAIGTGPNHGMIDISINGWFWRSFNGYEETIGEKVIEIPRVVTPEGETTGKVAIEVRSDNHHRSTGHVFRFKELEGTRILSVRRPVPHTKVTYTYDGADRLQQADYEPGTDYDYDYDLAGNLTDNNGTTRTYNAANQLTNNGTRTLAYDANGNLTSDGVNTYTWDRANRLTQVGNTTYSYDGLGNRVSQTVNTTKTDYLLDVAADLPQVIAATTGTSTERYIYGPRGLHAKQAANGDWTYTLDDFLGSVRAWVDDDQQIVQTHTYDPYGHPTTPMTGFAFTGEPRDANGLQYHRARYYNPSMAGWLSLDPVQGTMGRPMSLNGYLYVNGNPVMNTDPTGLFSRTRSLTPGLGGGSRRTRRPTRTRNPIRRTRVSAVQPRSKNPLVCGVPATVPVMQIEPDLTPIDLGQQDRSICSAFVLGGQWRDYAVCLSVQGFSYCPQGWEEAGINSSGYLSCRQNGTVLPAELLWPDQADELVESIDFGGSMFNFSISRDIDGYIEGAVGGITYGTSNDQTGIEVVWNFSTFQRMVFAYGGGGGYAALGSISGAGYVGHVEGFKPIPHEEFIDANHPQDSVLFEQFRRQYTGDFVFSSLSASTPIAKVGGGIVHFHSPLGMKDPVYGNSIFLSAGLSLEPSIQAGLGTLTYYEANGSGSTKSYLKSDCKVDIEGLQLDILSGTFSPLYGVGGSVLWSRGIAAANAVNKARMYNKRVTDCPFKGG